RIFGESRQLLPPFLAELSGVLRDHSHVGSFAFSGGRAPFVMIDLHFRRIGAVVARLVDPHAVVQVFVLYWMEERVQATQLLQEAVAHDPAGTDQDRNSGERPVLRVVALPASTAKTHPSARTQAHACTLN